MIQALFLTCALSLPPAAFKGAAAQAEYRDLLAFLQRGRPGSEFILVPRAVKVKNAERVPFIYKGYVIYRRSA